MNQDQTQQIQQQLEQAIHANHSVSIHGSGSHDFMLTPYSEQQAVDMTGHSGIINYQPTELTLKARCGTPINEIKQALAENHQCLPTDFPLYAENSTLGGCIAVGHTGSGRPFKGAIRDHILGTALINGSNQILQCGGQVMKNVAGYDISRLLSGSRGTLGVILDITLKVLPAHEFQQTLILELDEGAAIESMNQFAGQPLPMTACCFYQQKLYLRLQGTESGIQHAQQTIGGEMMQNDEIFWASIQNQTHEFFTGDLPVWRIVVPASAKLELENTQQSLIDWCGGLRWIQSQDISQADLTRIKNIGGYIEAQRGTKPTLPSELMDPLQKKMHQKLKQAFDPNNLFNPKLSHFE